MPETSNPLEIYHPSISSGDCAIIIVRDRDDTIETKVLIDLGCNTEEVILWSIGNINEFKNASFDYVIISHKHKDHYGGFKNNENIKATSWVRSFVNPDKDFKIGRNYYISGSNNPTRDVLAEIKINHSSNINIYDELSFRLSKQKKDVYSIKLSETHDIKLICLCANGIYLDQNNNYNIVYGKFSDWNDHSIAWLLEYKNDSNEVFRYFTAGDLSGSNDGGYTDIESKLIPYFNNNGSPITVDVLKATHHGSKHSLTQNFLNAIQPKHIIVPCNNSHLLPFPQFFHRASQLGNELKNIFIANYMEFPKAEYFDKGRQDGISIDLLNVSKNELKITPKLIIGDKNIVPKTQTKPEEKRVTLPVYITKVSDDGRFETKQHENLIELRLTAPSYSETRLPDLFPNEIFAKACFKKAIGKKSYEFEDFYAMYSDKKYFVQRDDSDYEGRREILSGFRNRFFVKNSNPAILNKEFLIRGLEYTKRPSIKEVRISVIQRHEKEIEDYLGKEVLTKLKEFYALTGKRKSSDNK